MPPLPEKYLSYHQHNKVAEYLNYKGENLGHSSQNMGFQSLVYGLSGENAQWNSLQNKSFILARKQMKKRRGQDLQKEEDTNVS